MIRQAINCDICGAEKQEAANQWLVAYEQAGELKLRGWESPKSSRKNAKHLCGQKCAQHLTANFAASVMAEKNVSKGAKEDQQQEAAELYGHGDREEMPLLERMGYDRETVTLIEADSWAGQARPKEPRQETRPREAKPKETPWETESKQKQERESFLNAARLKNPMARTLHRTA